MTSAEIADTANTDCQQRILMSIPDLAKQHGVSIRTARRMLRADYFQTFDFTSFYGDIIPARKIGKDGKCYPHHRRRYRKTVESSPASSMIRWGLNSARHGLKKADKLACDYGIQDKDFESLKSVTELANDILARWAGVMP